MAKSLSEQLRSARRRCREVEQKLSHVEYIFGQLCHAVGYDQLNKNWDQTFINGWAGAWLWPLYEFLNIRLGQSITADIRNQVMDVGRAIIVQLAVLGKYGVQLPYDPRPFDWVANEAKKDSQFRNIYKPCVVCGEDRITHECHIIPSAHGGPSHADNFFALCPLHHHLFDHARLNRQEWIIIEAAVTSKMESAAVYTKEVRFKEHEFFWNKQGQGGSGTADDRSVT